MFIDRIQIECQAGKGGNGIVAWRREKYIPKGGPTGGDGGQGGSIIFEADPNVSSLEWFAHKSHIIAESGQPGGSNCKYGKNGIDLLLKIPCGTLIKDADTQEVLCDITNPQQRYVACKGGKGGKGNHHFRSSTNRAPNVCTPGTEGDTKKLELELKLIADIGLIGFPNAGKSSLLNALAHQHVEVGAYPFTTLYPNLGFIKNDSSRLCIADIPGIIEGAHLNKGLGLEFLRHIERTKALIFVLDAAATDGRDPISDFETLRKELAEYNSSLLKRPCVITLNKCDVDDSKEHIAHFKERFGKKFTIFELSAQQHIGTPQLSNALFSLVEQKLTS